MVQSVEHLPSCHRRGFVPYYRREQRSELAYRTSLYDCKSLSISTNRLSSGKVFKDLPIVCGYWNLRSLYFLEPALSANIWAGRLVWLGYLPDTRYVNGRCRWSRVQISPGPPPTNPCHFDSTVCSSLVNLGLSLGKLISLCG